MSYPLSATPSRRRPAGLQSTTELHSSCFTRLHREECGTDSGSGLVGLTSLNQRGEASEEPIRRGSLGPERRSLGPDSRTADPHST